jgi:hypothetical protein
VQTLPIENVPPPAATEEPPTSADDLSTTHASAPGISVYEKLAAPFDATFKDHRGGVELEYITGEQAISRLNEVLGVAGWSFKVLEHGYNQEADEIWVLAELKANFGGIVVERQQFGSQKIKRSRATEQPLDIGFDLKGATTDALKKCAMALGVGLYLSRKEVPASDAVRDGAASQTADSGTLTCVQCEEELKEVRFRDGTIWTPAQLASYGRRKHGHVLCMQHYREANEARKRAEQVTVRPDQRLDEIPF